MILPISNHQSSLDLYKLDVNNLYIKWDNIAKNTGYPIDYQGITAKSEPLLARFHLLEGKNVLDIGCNSGIYSIYASRFAKSVIGCDLEQILIDRANIGRDFFSDYFDTSKLCFYCGNFVDKLNDDIDGVIAACVLYHIGDDNLQKLMIFLSRCKPLVILQARPSRLCAFSSNPAWGTVSNTTMFGGMFRLEDNIEFLRSCGYDNIFVAGLNSTCYYGEKFPIIIAYD